MCRDSDLKYVCYADPNLAPELAKASSDQIHELTRKTGGFKHTPAVGLDTTDTTKIFQLFFFVVHFIYALFTRRHRVPRAHITSNKFNAVLCTLIHFMNAE